MPLLIDPTTIRPSRLTPNKDKKYHQEFARWCLGTISNPYYQEFIAKTLINWSFFKGGDGQWILDEDLEAFFLDESGDIRNRIKMVDNIIKPMVNQYIGNAVRLSYNARAEATSDFAINRREEELKRLKFFEQAANAVPELNRAIRDRIPLGGTPIETEEIFENSWIDTHEEDINHLIKFIAKDISIDELKIQITRHLAISGLGVYKGYEQAGKYMGEAIDPLFFFWDMDARKPDLSDSEYMGEWYYMDTSSMFERWPKMKPDDRKLIETYSQNGSMDSNRLIRNYYTKSSGKVPVYEVYWRDSEQHEYAYVEDPYGYPFMTRINHETSDYTDKDIIDPPNEKHKKLLGKDRKQKIYVDVLRYCIFTPREEIGGSTRGEDIILEYGEAPYQEKKAADPSSVKFPYKCYTWTYDRGEVLSPLDDAISPQRFINRVKSVAESHINNARGTSTVVAKDAIDPRDGEEGVTRAINKSKPIFVDTTRTGSVQNSVGEYGTNIGAGTLSLFDVIRATQAGVENTTGVNNAMQGTQGGGDQLVGVLESQIQRGSIIQEPFYWALTSILNQAHEHMATVGKRIFADNPRRLAIAAGDRGLRNLTLTKDAMLEDFRIFVERSEGEKSAIQAGNQLLFTLVQAGLIDQVRFANLFNRADAEMIAKALREYHAEKVQAQNIRADIEAKRNAQIQNEMAQQQQSAIQQQNAMVENDNLNKQLDREKDLISVDKKEDAKMEREKLKYDNEALQ